jgi:hypothetical protein
MTGHGIGFQGSLTLFLTNIGVYHAAGCLGGVPSELGRHVEIADANAAIFDAAHGFATCLPGTHEVLPRQGLLEGTWCVDPREALSPGQAGEIDRVCRSYPHLRDNAFVRENLDDWLRS